MIRLAPKRMRYAVAALAVAATALLAGASPANAASAASAPGLTGLPTRAQAAIGGTTVTVPLIPKGTASDGQRSLAVPSCNLTIGAPFLSGAVVDVVAVVSCNATVSFIEMNVGIYRNFTLANVAYTNGIITSGLIGVVATPCPSHSTHSYQGAAEVRVVTFEGPVLYQPPLLGPGPITIFCP